MCVRVCASVCVRVLSCECARVLVRVCMCVLEKFKLRLVLASVYAPKRFICFFWGKAAFSLL